jgi:hypothetical protein
MSARVKRRSELDTAQGRMPTGRVNQLLPDSVLSAADRAPKGDDQGRGDRKHQGPDEHIGDDLDNEDRCGLNHPGSVHPWVKHRSREEHEKNGTRIPMQQARELDEEGIRKADEGPKKSGKTNWI